MMMEMEMTEMAEKNSAGIGDTKFAGG